MIMTSFPWAINIYFEIFCDIPCKMKMKKIICLFVIFSNFNISVFAQDVINVQSGPPGIWQQLGTVNVDFTVNHDDIVLMGPAEFKSIKFKAFDSPVNIVNVNLVYQNGKVDQLNIKYLLDPGAESKIIDVKRYPIRLRRVTIWYQTDSLAHGTKAKLALWGMK
jgi:hypothetical protein